MIALSTRFTQADLHRHPLHRIIVRRSDRDNSDKVTLKICREAGRRFSEHLFGTSVDGSCFTVILGLNRADNADAKFFYHWTGLVVSLPVETPWCIITNPRRKKYQMSFTQKTTVLTHQGVMAMLAATVECAEQFDRPQYIVIVDTSGDPLVQLKMTGAKFLSRKSATSKAMTAASNGLPTTSVPELVRPAIAAATSGSVTGLAGGLPVVVKGELLGGVGIGSGSPDQDLAVARAALSAIDAELFIEE